MEIMKQVTSKPQPRSSSSVTEREAATVNEVSEKVYLIGRAKAPSMASSQGESPYDVYGIPGVDEQFQCGAPIAGVWVNRNTGKELSGGILCPPCRRWTRCERCRVILLAREEAEIAVWLKKAEPVWALKLSAEPTKTEWTSIYESLRAEARRAGVDLTYALIKGSNVLLSNVDNRGDEFPQDPRERLELLRRALLQLNQVLHEGIVSGEPLKGHPIKKSKNLKRRRGRSDRHFRPMTTVGRRGQEAEEVRERLEQYDIATESPFSFEGGWAINFDLPSFEFSRPEEPPEESSDSNEDFWSSSTRHDPDAIESVTFWSDTIPSVIRANEADRDT